MPITKGFQVLVDEAMAQVTTHTVDAVRARMSDPKVQIVDIRDPRELERDGTVPGALLAPRGMLEFWVDPASPYFKPVFADESKQFILFCGAGWRSALATKTLQDQLFDFVQRDVGRTERVVQPTVGVFLDDAHRRIGGCRSIDRLFSGHS